MLTLSVPRRCIRQLRARQVDGAPHNVRERTCSYRYQSRTRAIQQRPYRAIDPLDLMAHAFQSFALRIVFVAAANQDIDPALNTRQWILDFMRQAGREFADERELCGTLQFGCLLENLLFG